MPPNPESVTASPRPQQEVQQQVEAEKQRSRCEELQAQVLHLQTENQELQSCLRGNHAQEGWFKTHVHTHDWFKQLP